MNHTVWVVDDDQSIRWVLERAYQRADIGVNSFESAEEAVAALASHARAPDAIICDVRMAGMSGFDLLAKVKDERDSAPPIIIMTAHADLDTAVNAYEGGAFEYIPKPFDVNEVIDTTRRAFSNNHSKKKTVERPPAGQSDLIGETPAMQQVFRAIGKLSRSNTTVLINGESGTGKELIARALHQHSNRSDQAFIALNMAAITHDLMESELFGHEKGAFTGATEQYRGRFEQANNGTLFLDEIGDMPANMQTRLLRVLSENQFYRVGGHTAVNVDVRIIAATHQNLEALVEQQLFREDLFHRLNVIRITAPALRNRSADVPLLLKVFLRRAAEDLGSEEKRSTEELDNYLSGLKWPGNVRQLENLARWLTVMSSATELHIEDLPADLAPSADNLPADNWQEALQQWAKTQMQENQTGIAKHATEQFERTLINCALATTGNRKQEAAILLGWGRNTLTRKMKEYDIQ
jgi:two-component system nitrogen regulation response regulator GlnG